MPTNEVIMPEAEGEVAVVELSVQPGTSVSSGDCLLVLESEKSTFEIPAEESGTLTEWLVQEGDSVTSGQALALLEPACKSAPADKPELKPEPIVPEPTAPSTKRDEVQASPPDTSPTPTDSQIRTASITERVERASNLPPNVTPHVNAGPAARKLARELGVDLVQVVPTGAGQRVQEQDIKSYVRHILTAKSAGTLDSNRTATETTNANLPQPDFSACGPIEITKRTPLEKTTARQMQHSWTSVPRVTLFDDVDIEELERYRKEIQPDAIGLNRRLTILPFMVKAVALALRDNPRFNAALQDGGEQRVQKHEIHIGFAVDTPDGLFVPVIRNADQKCVSDLAREIMDLSEKARARKLDKDEMRGAGFTITSLGALGGTGFTPMVNTPEVGILGLSKADIKPVWNGDTFEPRLKIPLSLSFDHSAVNGADAARFLAALHPILKNVRALEI